MSNHEPRGRTYRPRQPDAVRVSEADPRLVEVLSDAADKWGPLGVVRVAVAMWPQTAVVLAKGNTYLARADDWEHQLNRALAAEAKVEAVEALADEVANEHLYASDGSSSRHWLAASLVERITRVLRGNDDEVLDASTTWSCTTDGQKFPGCGTCNACRGALRAGWRALRGDDASTQRQGHAPGCSRNDPNWFGDCTCYLRGDDATHTENL